MKKTSTATLGIIVIFGSFIIFYIAGAGSIINLLATQGFMSILLLIIFSTILYRVRNEDSTMTIFVAFIAGVVGGFLDSGNFIYNKPLEWIYSSQGKLVFDSNTLDLGGRRYSIDNTVTLITNDGKVEELSRYVVNGFRFAEYFILFLIIGYVIRKIFKSKTTNSH